MDQERNVVISKTLSRILRHNPSGAVTIGGDGYTELSELVSYMRTIRPFCDTGLEDREVTETVATDPKCRFQIEGSYVRALSGHSFEVETGGVPYYPGGPLYFGTTEGSRRVLSEGLTLSKKLKVRLSATYHEASEVASARPGDSPLVIEVDAERLADDGRTFEVLSNGEILTDPVGADYLTEAREPIPIDTPHRRH